MILEALKIAEIKGFGFQVIKPLRFVTNGNVILSLAHDVMKASNMNQNVLTVILDYSLLYIDN